MAAGRISKLADPEFARQVAEVYISGMSKPEMAEEFDVNTDTIRRWVADPRVQAHAGRSALERINRITRRIDASIEARLVHIDKWDIEQVLKVRKEYLERSMKVGVDLSGDAKGATVNELAEAMDQDPDLAEALRKLVGG